LIGNKFQREEVGRSVLVGLILVSTLAGQALLVFYVVGIAVEKTKSACRALAFSTLCPTVSCMISCGV